MVSIFIFLSMMTGMFIFNLIYPHTHWGKRRKKSLAMGSKRIIFIIHLEDERGRLIGADSPLSGITEANFRIYTSMPIYEIFELGDSVSKAAMRMAGVPDKNFVFNRIEFINDPVDIIHLPYKSEGDVIYANIYYRKNDFSIYVHPENAV